MSDQPHETPSADEPASTPAEVISFTQAEHRTLLLGNLTGLGLGMWSYGRRGLGVTLAVITLLLAFWVTSSDGGGWFARIVLLLWWLLGLLMAYSVATDKEEPDRKNQRVTPDWPYWLNRRERHFRLHRRIAVGGVAVVAAVLAFGAFDDYRLTSGINGAHQNGECSEALERIDQRGRLHRLVDPFANSRDADATDACDLLREARSSFETDRAAAIDLLREYLDHPAMRWEGAGELWAEAVTEVALEGFVAAFEGGDSEIEEPVARLLEVEATPGTAEPLASAIDQMSAIITEAEDECRVVSVWNERPDGFAEQDLFGPAREAFEARLPDALLSCGEATVEDGDLDDGERHYVQFLDEYPDHERAEEAEAGIERIEYLHELEQVQALFDGWPSPTGGDNDYCGSPVGYPEAADYGGSGYSDMAVFGDDDAREAVSNSLIAESMDEAVLVACVDLTYSTERGITCDYGEGPYGNINPVTIDVKEPSVSVVVYEFATGKQVRDYESRIVGPECPESITYYGDPPDTVRAEPTDDQIASTISGAFS